MKIALLGQPQAGKRTLFSLLTGQTMPEFRSAKDVLSGRAFIKDPRVEKMSQIENPDETVFAENNFLLCPDIELNSGKYDWLEEARKSDLIALVVRDFDSDDVFHPQGSVDSARDRDNLLSELILADLDLVEKRLERISKENRKIKQTKLSELEEKLLQQFQEQLEQEKFLNELELSEDEFSAIKSLNFITQKPYLLCYNVSEDNLAKDIDANSFAVSALIEKELLDIEDPLERAEYLQELGIEMTGVDRLNAKVYEMLGLMSFYTTGKDEVRAWTIQQGSLAPIAGGKIHSDIQRGFIRVEVIKYDDFVSCNGEKDAKAQGKMKTKGKDYAIEDGDICHFLFNV